MKTRVIYMVVDTNRLTLYKEDGESVVIPQGDKRVARLLEEAMPAIQAQGYADVDLSGGQDTVYSDYEEQSGGLVRFFRVAKTKLKSILGMESTETDPQLEANIGYYGDPTKLTNTVLEVMAHAKPATSGTIGTGETVVAVVGNTVLPDAARLKNHIAHSVKTGSTKGMDAFFGRIAGSIEKRGHSVDDLLRFMEKGDLPVANDGSIIAYKLVRSTANEGVFVDCHTGNVSQQVGSFVCVPEELVDANRRESCSNGLHIARRDYLGGFHGDVCLLVKVAPEDVIAVPHGENSKIRVCGYHIIDRLSPEATKRVKANGPMTGLAEAEAMLARAIAGEHIGRTEIVQITKHRGEGVIITPIGEPQPSPNAAPEVSKVKNAVALDDDRMKEKVVPPVEVRGVNAKLKASKGTKDVQPTVQATLPAKVDRKVEARRLMAIVRSISLPYKQQLQAADQLFALKKASKKGWSALGISDTDLAYIEQIRKAEPVPAPVKASKKTRELSAKMKAPQVQATVAKATKTNDNKPTDRERKVLDLRKKKLSVSEISRQTGVSRRQVDRILNKFAA